MCSLTFPAGKPLGITFEWNENKNELTVSSITPDNTITFESSKTNNKTTIATKSLLTTEDVLAVVNGIPVAAMSFAEVVSLLRAAEEKVINFIFSIIYYFLLCCHSNFNINVHGSGSGVNIFQTKIRRSTNYQTHITQ